MAEVGRSALGLSIGATNVAAVTVERAMTRRAVLTLYRERPPEVGVPSENPMLNEPGLVIPNFVERVGNPEAIVAADGTTHRSQTLVADALRALAYAATDGRALPEAVAVSYPTHWAPTAVNAVRVALSRVSEWSGDRVTLLPDFEAALIALQANPGVPSRGIIAVCDFGGTGTTLTLVDAANGYQPIAPPVRHAGFSGDLIDQALLTHVIADLSSAGSFDTAATSGIGSLAALRGACRRGKEQLSSTTATTLAVEVPGFSGDVQVTRHELDEAIRQPLDGFLNALHHSLQRNGIRAANLVAIASVGGGASIPAVTTTLSQQLGVPIITAPRPQLTAAIGSALRASRGPADSQTALAPTAAAAVVDAPTMADLAVEPNPAPALAWSEADDDSGIMPLRPGEYPEEGGNAALTAARPQAVADRDSGPAATPAASEAWYRRPPVVMIGTALMVLAITAAVMIAMRHTSGSGPIAPAPGGSTAPASSQNSSPSDATDTQAPGSSAPSSTESATATPSSTTTQAPTTTTTSQAPTTTSSAPTTTSAAPTTTQGSQRPGFPGFPRGPRLLPQPLPGYG